MIHYTVVKKETLLKTPRFSVVHEALRSEEGADADFTYLDKPNAVAVLPIACDSAYLVEQYRHVVGSSLLEVPGGRIESGEQPEAAAHRELAEECSFSCGELLHVGTVVPMPSVTNEIIHVFLARSLRPVAAHPDPSEDSICVRKVELARLASLLREGSRIPPVDGFILYRILVNYYPNLLESSLERKSSNE